jgi:hypothetical protein
MRMDRSISSIVTGSQNRPKALLVDINSKYINNPTRSLIWQCLSLVFEIEYYGPGFSTLSELQAGLTTYIKKNGPYVHIFTTSHIAFCSSEMNKVDPDYSKIFYFTFPREYLRFVPRIRAEILEMENQKSLFALDVDFWNIGSTQIAILDRFRFIFGMGDMLWPKKRMSEVKDIWKLPANDNWEEFLASRSKHVIDFPHFISLDEFTVINSIQKKQLWCVPGVQYSFRREFRRHLLAKGIKPRVSNTAIQIARIRRLGFFDNRQLLLLALSRHRYKEMISTSTFSFACGSGIGMALRKYFEIPAYGSVLVCEEIPSLNWLGFENGNNCLTISRDCPIEGIDRIMSMTENEIRDICIRGWHHVLDNHSIVSRSNTIAKYLLE